ncbi:hypothetical protein MASR2M15_07980 [Anaerolineales bacterium]
MLNPLELAPPDDPIQQVHELARDLAYGAIHKHWSARLVKNGDEIRGNDPVDRARLDEYMQKKWDRRYPASYLLEAFGYLEIEVRVNNAPAIKLTEKAFQLLNQAVVADSIFISYRRDESSALAVLILTRLKAAGLNAFLDIQDLRPGDDWHQRLHDEVQVRPYFILLIGPTTLASEYVREEIRWALDTNKHIIPIWHNGYQGEVAQPTLSVLAKHNAIIVAREHPLDYQNVVTSLLNLFGITEI